jgi:hypothetical protein
MSDASSYPVTPLAAFGLSDAFDNWDAINAQNLVSLSRQAPLPKHAGMKPSGWQVDGRGLVHVWSTSHRIPAVPNGLQRFPAARRSRRPPLQSWGNKPWGRTLIRMKSEVQVLPGPPQGR